MKVVFVVRLVPNTSNDNKFLFVGQRGLEWNPGDVSRKQI